jgi:hypothetical protein
MGLEPMTSGANRRRADQAALCPSFNGLLLLKLVGTVGFEPTTSCTPCMRATRLRYAPNVL